ncbi:PREDICTED: uncharacterized protein LOC109158620 [Ipomoea nil]|uniref:uncharacterized protein LOC109158620 n=1 Tax=Ipomoea nil TaxID=35883 RepID=UPI000901F60F|nr:PREDICTED: uncharacterized protein LOC109158620 [Ipomoea nil]
MEGVSVNVYNGIKQYWKTKRKGYERISRGGRRRKFDTGDGASGRKKPSWRIKLTPKIKLNFNLRFSPKKLLIRLRNAYVNMMLRIANTRVIGGGGGMGMGGFSGDTVASFGARPLKEYDERMLVQIYKSMLAAHGQTQLVPRDAPPRIATPITCRR